MSGEKKPRVVVCAALITDTGVMVCGSRHFDAGMNRQISELHIPWNTDWSQGFIDQYGAFMTRQEAYEVAKDAGQIKYRCGGDEGKLFSENLY